MHVAQNIHVFCLILEHYVSYVGNNNNGVCFLWNYVSVNIVSASFVKLSLAFLLENKGTNKQKIVEVTTIFQGSKKTAHTKTLYSEEWLKLI